MIEKLYEDITNKTNVRQALSNLRKEIKNEREKERFIRLCKGDYSKLLELLSHEDAKTRKPLLIGTSSQILDEYDRRNKSL